MVMPHPIDIYLPGDALEVAPKELPKPASETISVTIQAGTHDVSGTMKLVINEIKKRDLALALGIKARGGMITGMGAVFHGGTGSKSWCNAWRSPGEDSGFLNDLREYVGRGYTMRPIAPRIDELEPAILAAVTADDSSIWRKKHKGSDLAARQRQRLISKKDYRRHANAIQGYIDHAAREGQKALMRQTDNMGTW